jgi:hypothetical protein
MKQEEKELLLKDLSSRLSYGVKIFVDDKIETLDGLNILDNVIEYGTILSCDIEEVKPYLFPLSSMTEEQWIDLKEYSGFKYDGCLLDLVKYTDSVSTLEFWVEEIPSNMIIRVFDWLNKNHFDYRGLIQLGLAIDATGLGIY